MASSLEPALLGATFIAVFFFACQPGSSAESSRLCWMGSKSKPSNSSRHSIRPGAGATIRRMSDFLFAELEHSDTLLTNEIAIRSFEENLALCVMLGLPHNYTERLRGQKAAAAPGNVKRAEAFMRANAGTPLTIAEIAEAAGCGVRALQIAFQRFRGTTPMRVLQQARLEQARTEMLRADQTESLARIAAEHGFSSPTRFAQSFRRKYGVYPSEMLRGGASP